MGQNTPIWSHGCGNIIIILVVVVVSVEGVDHSSGNFNSSCNNSSSCG